MSLLEVVCPPSDSYPHCQSLFRRFAQNERSLFALLNSSEPHGLQDFLATQTYDGRVLPTFTLSNLYDYIYTALGSGLYTSREGAKWAEIESAIERLPDPSPMTVKLIKTIGLLAIVGESSVNLKASKALLRYALDDGMESFQNAVNESVESSLAMFGGTFHYYLPPLQRCVCPMGGKRYRHRNAAPGGKSTP